MRIEHYGNQLINEADIAAVTDALKQEVITRGNTVQRFEKAVAEYVGAKYAVACCNGTAALYMAYRAMRELSPPIDNTVAIPNNTFQATANAAFMADYVVHLMDVCYGTGNLDVAAFRKWANHRDNDIVVPVHFGGQALPLKDLADIQHQGISAVIEDAAHALGAYYPEGGHKVGCCKHSEMTCFSFHPLKTITSGEGGMVTTNSPDLHRLLLSLRDHGRGIDGLVSLNFHMSDIAAALGLSQLKRIDEITQRRGDLMDIYQSQLDGDIFFPWCSGSAFHLANGVCHSNGERNKVVQYCRKNGIGHAFHYPPLEVGVGRPLVAADRYSKAITLPLHEHLEDGEVYRLCAMLRQVLND